MTLRNAYYNADGRAITSNEWSADRTGDPASSWSKAHRVTKVEAAEVSTVWLGLDHQFEDGPPLIFESMVFGGGLDQCQERYPTLAEAHAGHDALVEKVRVEADAFRALAADEETRAAVHLIQERLTAHLTAFDIYDYDGRAYTRLVEATK